jgi:hypothetical protein
MAKSLSRQQGASFVLWLVALVPLLGFAALALDVNNVLGSVAELSNAADAGALAGAVKLYNNEDGSVVEWAGATDAARAAALANVARGTAVEVRQINIGHWQFLPEGGGHFTPVSPGTSLPDLVGKTFYDPSDPTSCNNLNNPCSGDINAVEVVTERNQTPVQRLFGWILGIAQDYQTSARAVAYRGFAGGLNPHDVDQPIAICQESLLQIDSNTYQCNVGRFMPSTLDTGGWTDFNQVGACEGGTNTTLVRDLICQDGNEVSILFGKPMATDGGEKEPLLVDLAACWVDNSLNQTVPWKMTLPVIVCNGKNPGPCNSPIGAVTVNVLWIVNKANKIGDDAPKEMAFPDLNSDGVLNDGVWHAPAGTEGTAEAEGIARWNSFVEAFNIMGFDTNDDGVPDHAYYNDNPQLNGWRQNTIYFAPDCAYHQPKGLTSVLNFGIRAEVPVLVD